MGAEQRLVELGIALPPPPAPVASYVPARRSGSLLYLSGHGPVPADGRPVVGAVGRDLTVDEGRNAAFLCGLGLLATMRSALGSLDRVTGIVKVLGMVRAAPDFLAFPAVIDGCSDLLVAVFGDAGRHARSAVGVDGLPFGIAVEIELVAEIA